MSGNGAGPLLQVRDVVQEFEVRGRGGVKAGVVHAVSGVSFDVASGETLGVVGETGSGKSTLARAVLQAPPPKSGSVVLEGRELVGLKGRSLLDARRSVQMVFQDPYGSLDPRWRVSEIVEEPLAAYGVGTRAERRQRVREVLDRVGLDPDAHGRRRPRRLSGGQAPARRHRSRAGARPGADHLRRGGLLARRADPGAGAQPVRGAAGRPRASRTCSSRTTSRWSSRCRIAWRSCIWASSSSSAPAEALYREPLHPYTVALLASIPSPDPESPRNRAHAAISGDVPSPIDPPSGCRFARAARARRTSARARSRRSASWRAGTRSPATSRWSARSP